MLERLYTEHEVAEALQVSVAWLRQSRVKGQGIPFVKFGRNVRYRPEDIRTYMEMNRNKSTSRYCY